MIDIALVSIPRLSIEVAPLNIAQLKSCVVDAGFTCKCFDANIELYHSVDFSTWLEVDDYFQTDLRYTGNDVSHIQRKINFDVMHEDKLNGLRYKDVYLNFLDKFVDKVLSENPKWIGISIFSVNSALPGIDICKIIKKKRPGQKIVIGGMGVSSFGVGTRPNYGEYMKSRGLVDEYISGEGEYSIVSLLKDEEIPFPPTQIDDLNVIPYSNYDDFDLESYDSKNLLYITGSRGCVRSCTFCDIQSLWKKFRFRSPENIVGEMVLGYSKYGATEFYFTDSLINGSQSQFIKLCELIIEKKSTGELPDNLMFGGQWICRPKDQFKEYAYEVASRAGLYNLSIGVESGSDQVLASMKKGVTKQDYDFQMEMLQKYGIRCNFLMIIGYPTETEEDFQSTLQMFRDYKQYSDSGIIWGVNLGKTLVILPGADLGISPGKYGIHYDSDNNWSNPEIGLTYDVRLKRRLEAQLLLESLGYVIKSTVTTINSLYEIKMKGGYDSIA